MEYKILRNAKAPAGRAGAISLPLRNLQVAKEVNGMLEGDAFLIPGKTLKQISGSVYKQAEAQGVAVALRTDEDGKGVKVFRIKKPKDE